ncbi:MAG: alpha-hydroxy acid oxidase [Alcaligenaceae bacterium]|nr:alpha-hydroxy acid oxidase [Alcaligenaceae bacterium]
MPLPPLSQIPSSIAAVDDYIPYAKERMSAQAWAYFSGGVADERLLSANQSAWQQFHVLPQLLTDFQGATTRFSLLGKEYEFPIFLAPIAYQTMAHPDGEFASALAAAAMQTPYIISMQSATPLAVLCEQAPGPKWLQWYWQEDKSASTRLLEEAFSLGVEAIVLTVDAPVNGVRNREQRAAFCLPTEVEAVLLREFKSQSRPLGGPGQSPLFGSEFLVSAPTWEMVAEFIRDCPLPVILKGVINPIDAEKAIEIGAAAIVVSNHGARVLDILPPTARVLSTVCEVVAGRIPVLVDGGIRRGSDVFVALALGATAVMIGRPYLYAMAAAGASGVAHVLHLLRTELEVAMTLTGCRNLEEIREVALLRE